MADPRNMHKAYFLKQKTYYEGLWFTDRKRKNRPAPLFTRMTQVANSNRSTVANTEHAFNAITQTQNAILAGDRKAENFRQKKIEYKRIQPFV